MVPSQARVNHPILTEIECLFSWMNSYSHLSLVYKKELERKSYCLLLYELQKEKDVHSNYDTDLQQNRFTVCVLCVYMCIYLEKKWYIGFMCSTFSLLYFSYIYLGAICFIYLYIHIIYIIIHCKHAACGASSVFLINYMFCFVMKP